VKSVGFAAVAAPDARVLILGSLPGVKSLQEREYYAHPQNSFWWIMSELVGASPKLTYPERLQRLTQSGIALWDVCRAAERVGSLDSRIQLESIEANDFCSFFAAHPRIELICFNGQPAQKLFRHRVLPSLVALSPLPQQVLDSTSPANARISREEKLTRWRFALGPFLNK
jgi:hypoxanthine-DNA glycosylase